MIWAPDDLQYSGQFILDNFYNWRLASMLNKVPEVTLAFWIIKIMSTTVGETGADYLAVHVGLGRTVTDCVMAALLIASLLLQLRSRQYVTWRY